MSRGPITVIPRTVQATAYGVQRKLEYFEARLLSGGPNQGSAMVGFDPGTTGLTANDVQAALEEMIGTSIVATATNLTIAGGVVTVTQSAHKIDTEAAAVTDDLNTLLGLVNGFYVLSLVNAAHNVVLKHGTGNIVCPYGQDVTLDVLTDYVMIFSDGTNAYVLSLEIADFAGGGLGALLGSTTAGEGAALVGYDNVASGLVATDVQAALDEIATAGAHPALNPGWSVPIVPNDAVSIYIFPTANMELTSIEVFAHTAPVSVAGTYLLTVQNQAAANPLAAANFDLETLVSGTRTLIPLSGTAADKQSTAAGWWRFTFTSDNVDLTGAGLYIVPQVVTF